MFKMNQKGFSLMELMVAIAIISIMTSMSVVSYRDFNNSKALSFGLKQFLMDFRVVQNNALGVLQHNGDIPDGGYGIRISTGDSSYIMFADDDGEYDYDGGTEIISIVDLPSGVTINSITINSITTTPVDIIFSPPYGEVFINTKSTFTESEVIKVEIEICSSSSLCKTFIVNSEGLIGE